MEIKIGISQSPREIALETEKTSEEVAATVVSSLDTGKSIEFTDTRGRRLIVAADKLAYVEIGEPSQRRVGFGG